jgi:hypothetical protein
VTRKPQAYEKILGPYSDIDPQAYGTIYEVMEPVKQVWKTTRAVVGVSWHFFYESYARNEYCYLRLSELRWSKVMQAWIVPVNTPLNGDKP